MDRILVAADLHGNMDQYRRVFAHAKENKFDVVVFAGDLTPKDTGKRTPRLQRQFLAKELFPLLDSRDVNEPHALFIMGNDDFASNHEIMVSGQDFHRYRMIAQVPYVTQGGFNIIGYSHVPYTPFPYKDWERRDLASDTDYRHRPDIMQTGLISRGFDLLDYDIALTMRDYPSIEDDLNRLAKGLDLRKTILVSHAPPHNTLCDLNRENKHVGSRALRQFVEARQPYMTISGHIHETVDKSGAFVEQIGETTCTAVGNDHRPAEPFVLEVITAHNARPLVKRLALK